MANIWYKGISADRCCSPPTALIRRAIFKNFVKYSRYGYEMKALGLKTTVNVIMMSQCLSLPLKIPETENSHRFSARFEGLNKADL